ncbi:MAG: DUF1573 domain-containing protein [Pyrinomonadaceae bacterium]|nr:DUF1573 domain-containing protein [Phycisphaerales bacterium]
MLLKKSLKAGAIVAAASFLALGVPFAGAQTVDSKVQPATKPVPPRTLAPTAPPQPGVDIKSTGQPVDPHGGVSPTAPELSPLSWDNMAHNFGNIPDTEAVTHVFKFTNKTDKTVTILRAHGSCGCTVPDLPKKSFQPGESGEMSVTFNPQHRRGANPKAVTIEYSEPAGTPNTMVTINSNVQPLVIIEPMKMYLMEVDAKAGKSTEITISGRKSDFAVTSIDKTSDALDIKLGEVKEVQIDGDTFKQVVATVTIKPGTPIGEIQTELAIKTNEEKAPSTNYVFFADVVGDIKATPAKLTLRAFTPKVPFSNVVSLESRTAKPFKVLSVDVEGREDMNLVADVETNNMNGKPVYTIKLNGVTPDVMGLVSGEIIVKTDLPDNDTIRLPFNATIRGSQAPIISPAAAKVSPAKS